jgi:phosphatidylserine synthase
VPRYATSYFIASNSPACSKRVPLWVILVCVIAIAVVASSPSLVLWALFLSYALSGYVMWAMGHRVRPVLPEE